MIIGGSTGLSIVSMLDKEGIPTIIGEVKENTRSNFKITNSEGVTTEFNEAGPSFSADAYEAMTEELFELVVEDFKGFPNDRWPLKKAMMLYFHGISIREIKKPTEPI